MRPHELNAIVATFAALALAVAMLWALPETPELDVDHIDPIEVGND